MLQELRVRDFAIIEDLHLVLGGGFTVFTGETGAGKSIIIDAMEMLLGGRADSTAVRAASLPWTKPSAPRSIAFSRPRTCSRIPRR